MPGAVLQQPMAAVLINLQVIQEPTPERAQYGVHGLGSHILEANAATGPFVVATGRAQAVDRLAKHFSGMRPNLVGPQRNSQLIFVQPRAPGPVHPVEPDEEICQLGHDVWLRHHAQVAHNHLSIKKGVREGVLERGEIALR